MPMRREESSRYWVRIPLRIDPENLHIYNDGVTFGDDNYGGSYEFENRYYGAREPVTVFHNTKLESLVQPTMDQSGENPLDPVLIGEGILNEQRLYHGACTHDQRHGVNVNVDGSWMFERDRGWVALECLAVCTVKLPKTWKKYCVRGQPYTKCFKVALKALWVPYDELPAFIFLTG